ncbi:MAG: hypothetical protein JWP06_454 [Candidatus Saccharibacteria bacterium]|nr:hypothetical protein [Candidatus Saccharibacteria bacterium]
MSSINRTKFARALTAVGINVGIAGVAMGSVYAAAAGPIIFTIGELIKLQQGRRTQDEVKIVRKLREQTRNTLRAHGLPHTDADIAIFYEVIIEYARHDTPYEAMGEYLAEIMKKK